jgi:hypothetical protein
MGLAMLCALLSTKAQGDEPQGPRTLAAVADTAAPIEAATSAAARRLPPVEPSGVVGVSLAGGSSLPILSGVYDAQPVGYLAAAAAESTTTNAKSLNPVQEPLFRFSGMQDPEEKKEAEPQSAEAGQPPAAAGQEQTYGQAPTNNALQFLRDVDVLLAPGAWQADTGFVYTHFANDFPLALVDPMGDVVGVEEAEVRRRLLYTPLAVRYGLTTNIQLFAALPAGFSNTQISAFNASETTNVSGIGDMTFGASVHLFDGEDQMPDVIGTIGFTAPTGKFGTPLFGLVPGSNLGQGFWAYNAQLLFIHRYDPVIVFYGGGYRHLWERTFDGQVVSPGEQANYMLGVGFSVNDRVTLSSTFQGFYITNTYVNDVNIRGSNLEPLSLRFAATIVRDCRIIEPFVQIGATDSAPRVNVGVVVTFY